MVLVCQVDEVNPGEDSSEPAGSTAIRLYSPTGSLLDEILPPERDADSRIGPVAWNADGSALAVTAGYLSEPIMGSTGFTEIPHQARAMYVWTRADGTFKKITDISGQIGSLSWVEDSKAIEAWFRMPGDQEVKVQSGVRIYLDGMRAEVQRPAAYHFAEGGVIAGSLGDWVLLERFGTTGGSLVAVRSGAGDGLETVVTDVGPLDLGEPVTTPGAFAISGEVPDTYGQGDHWIYIVVQRR